MDNKTKAELLVKNGFINSKYKDLYPSDPKSLDSNEFKDIFDPKHADNEEWEQNKDQFLKTGYPQPLKHFRIVMEKPNQSIEGAYYWIWMHTHEMLGYPEMHKTIDTFSASENSAFLPLKGITC